MRIGVLALQGGFSAHLHALSRVGHEPLAVRYPHEIEDLEGLVLPGGESSTQLELLGRAGLEPALAGHRRRRRPILATCAGLILLAERVSEPTQRSLAWIDVSVRRNGWGPQRDSFEARSDRWKLPLVFIRAPRIEALGAGVEVLDTLDGEPILVRQENVVAATFHPELTDAAAVFETAFGEPGGAAGQRSSLRSSPLR